MTKLGFYLRSRPELEDVLTSKAAYAEFLVPLLDLLTDQLGYLRREDGDGPETHLYRLNVETIEWRASDGLRAGPGHLPLPVAFGSTCQSHRSTCSSGTCTGRRSTGRAMGPWPSGARSTRRW